MGKGCLNCGADLSHVNKGAKFCKQECRNAYNYKKRSKKNSKDKGLKGITPDQLTLVKEEPEPIAEPVIKQNEKLLPPALRNTIWINADNTEADPIEEEKTQQLPETEPPRYLEKITEASNPEYEKYSALLEKEKRKKEWALRQIKVLEANLKQQQERNGNDIVVIGLIAGGALGLIYSPSEKTQEGEMVLSDKNGKQLGVYSKSGKKKKKVKESRYTTIENILLGMVLGTGAGYLGKKLTEKQREADKQEKISAIKKRIDALQGDINIADFWIEQHEYSLKKQPLLLTTKSKVPNPDYDLYLKHRKKDVSTDKDELGSDIKENIFTPKSKKIVSAKDFGNEPMQVLNFQGPWQEFFDQPSTNFHCLIHGNPGEGKSTFCLWFARYLAQNFGRVVYVSGEEGRNSTFQNKLKFCEAQVEGLYISDIRTGEEFLQEVSPDEFNFVIFDSLHDMDIKPALIREIFEKFPNTGIIAIEQNNKSGDIYGTNAMKHTFDIVVNVANYTAETTKNRFKQKGVSLPTAEFGQDFEKEGSGLRVIKLSNPDSEYPEDPETKKIV